MIELLRYTLAGLWKHFTGWLIAEDWPEVRAYHAEAMKELVIGFILIGVFKVRFFGKGVSKA